MLVIEKVLNKDNTNVLVLLMLYENRNTTIFNVLESVIYCIMGTYVCVNYIYLHKGLILLAHKGCENTPFNDISETGIMGSAMNIVSCNVFVKENNTTIILTCRGKLVSYYLSKVFLILDKNYMS